MMTIKDDPWQGLTQEDATRILIEWLKNLEYGMNSNYGYEAYLPSLASRYLEKKHGIHPSNAEIFSNHSELFYDLAWDLCLRGILRLGLKTNKDSHNPKSAATGNGYSITAYGKEWLKKAEDELFIPTEPDAFAKVIGPYQVIFGDNFHQRAQEAIKCYHGQAFLACCAMCGAAAEAILLSIAISKLNDEEQVLKIYKEKDGRKKLEEKIIGAKKDYIKQRFDVLNGLLKHWRDESAHGSITLIDRYEALQALYTLLNLAQFMEKERDNILN